MKTTKAYLSRIRGLVTAFRSKPTSKIAGASAPKPGLRGKFDRFVDIQAVEARLMASLLTGLLVAVGLLLSPFHSRIGHAAPNETILFGTITSASGEQMEGVVVS